MNKPEISIIVPVYNIEQYIRQCLDSIEAQSFTNWECIIVDDGSTDGSPEICDEYATKDPRFRVIHKPNGGVSSARNVGLDNIQGEFVGFVDPDDWAEPDLFKHLLELIKEHNADIAQVGLWYEYRNRRKAAPLTNETKSLDRNEAILALGFDVIPNYLCNKLHRREIITCRFPEGRTFEDILVYGEWMKNVSKMVIDPTLLYHYRMRMGSIGHANPSQNRLDYFIACIDRMEKVRQSLDNLEITDRRMLFLNASAVGAAKMIARQEHDPQTRINGILKVREKLLDFPMPPLSSCFKPKLRWRSYLLRNHPKFFSWLMRAVFKLNFDSKKRQKYFFD